jgi:hypothetical protein
MSVPTSQPPTPFPQPPTPFPQPPITLSLRVSVLPENATSLFQGCYCTEYPYCVCAHQVIALSEPRSLGGAPTPATSRFTWELCLRTWGFKCRRRNPQPEVLSSFLPRTSIAGCRCTLNLRSWNWSCSVFEITLTSWVPLCPHLAYLKGTVTLHSSVVLEAFYHDTGQVKVSPLHERWN